MSPGSSCRLSPARGLVASLVIALSAAACDWDNDSDDTDHGVLSLPAESFDYQVDLPFYYEVNTNLQGPFQNSALDNDNTPEDNPVTNAGATLGRVLFYDTRLSSTGEISCAQACHLQEFGFSDPEVFSIGVDGTTPRNSMGLANARFYLQTQDVLPLPVNVEPRGAFFWDERAESLEEQVLEPFESEIEMGMTLEAVVDIVSSQAFYPPLFEAAFGDPEVTEERIAKALAQFVRSIVSLDSRYDVGRQALAVLQGEPESGVGEGLLGPGLEDFPTFTEQENLGKRLFNVPRQTPQGLLGPCGGCHLSDAMVSANTGAVNNGVHKIESEEARALITQVINDWRLPPNEVGEDGFTNAERYQEAVDRLYAWMDDDPNGDLGDLGVGGSMDRETSDPWGIAQRIGAMKAPSLRNIVETAPYMHDGRFATLEEVLDHYSDGVIDNPHPSLHLTFRGQPFEIQGDFRSYNFTDEEKAALIAFLHTLSDPVVLTDEKWSDPFIRD